MTAPQTTSDLAWRSCWSRLLALAAFGAGAGLGLGWTFLDRNPRGLLGEAIAHAAMAVAFFSIAAGLALLSRRMARTAAEQRALVAARERAEAELAERSFEQRAVFDEANDAIIVSDRDGRILAANKRFSEWYGYGAGETERLRLRDVTASDSGERLAERLRRLAPQGALVGETRHRRKDGTTFPVIVSTRLVEERGLARAITIVRDISELRAAEAKRRAMLDGIDAEVCLLDASGRVIEINAAWEKALRTEADCGRRLAAPGEDYLAHLEERAAAGNPDFGRLAREIRRLFEGETARVEHECLWEGPGGQRWSLIVARPLRSEGAPQGTIVAQYDVTAVHRANEAVAASEIRFRSVVQAISDGVVLVDEGGVLIDINPAAERISGVPRALALGRTLFDGSWGFSHEDGTPFTPGVGPVRDALRTGEPQRGRIVGFRRPDGRRIWIEIGVEPLFLGAGKEPTHAVVTFRDVTERRLADERRRVLAAIHEKLIGCLELDEVLRAVCEGVVAFGLDLAWIGFKRPDGSVEIAAKGGAKLSYLEGIEVRWDESPAAKGPVGMAIRTGTVSIVSDVSTEPRFGPWRERAERHGLSSVAGIPLRAPGGVIGALAAYSKERSAFDPPLVAMLEALAHEAALAIQAARAHAALRASEASMRRVMHAIEQASEGIVITDRAGTILYANPSVSRQSGYAQKEILDATPRIFKSGAHDQAFYQNLWQTILAGETWRGVITNRRKDGTLYQVSAVIAPVRDEGGEIVNFVALNRDMTQELLLEAQLRQAQKLEVVGQLAGGIAHDFNNALAGVSGYADLAMLEVKPDSQLHFYLKEIRRSSDRAAGIARQLLLFSRRQKAEPQPLDLNGVVEGLSKMLRRLLGENVKIEMALAPALGIVEADPGQIEQVITNLCLNARDAMPEGGRITIATANVAANEARPPPQPLAGPDSPPRRPEGPWVLLSVSDTGTGMSPEVRSRIFEPFFTTKPPGKGTGLGLSVVHGIVLGHGGWIDVETAPGRGTTMKLFFPRAGGETKLRPDGGRDAALPRGSETILLVEDEESVRSMATRVLEQLGYRVLVAASGYEALGLADRTEGAIDLLVTDVVMPNLAGPKVAADLAARRPGLRVLFITGYAPETLGDLEASGAAVLLKPFGVGELARKVREALSVSR